MEGWPKPMQEILLDHIKGKFAPIKIGTEGIKIRVLKGRPWGKQGMLLLIGIYGKGIVNYVKEIAKKDPNIIYSDFQVFSKSLAIGEVVTRSSPFCRVIMRANGFCIPCPANEYAQSGHFRIVLPKGARLKEILEKMQELGISPLVRELGKPLTNYILTPHQYRAINAAKALGYYNLPRRANLSHISKELGISSSTLDEVIRRAGAKIIKNYLNDHDQPGDEYAIA